MSTWCVVQAGRWTGAVVSGPESDARLSVPPGGDLLAGHPRELLDSGAMQPPMPPVATLLATHRWCSDALAYVQEPTPRALAARRRAEVLAQIADHERAAARPLRELLLNPRGTAARQRLADIDAAIARLRAELAQVDAAAATPPEP